MTVPTSRLAAFLSWEKLSSFLVRRREHVLNLSSFFFARVFSLALFAFSASFFINHAGTNKYGTLTLLFVIFSYLHIFDLGMGYALNVRFARRLARGGPKPERMIQRAIPFYVLAAAIIASLMAFFAPQLSNLMFRTTVYADLLRLMSCAIIFMMFSALCTAILQAYNRIYLINTSRTLIEMFRAAGMIAGALKGGDLKLVVEIAVVGSALKMFLDIALTTGVLGHWNWLKPRLSWKELKLNFGFGYPIMMTVGIGMLTNSLDKIFISRTFTAETLSYYSIAFDLNTKAYFLIWAVNGSLYTVLQRRSARKNSSKDLVFLSFLTIFIMIILYYLPLYIFSKEILGIWISPEFAKNSYEFVRMMVISSIMYLLMSILYNIVQSRGRARSIFKGDLIAFLAFVSGLLILPQYIGLNGVILSLAASYLAQSLYLLYDLKWLQLNFLKGFR